MIHFIKIKHWIATKSDSLIIVRLSWKQVFNEIVSV